MFALTYTDLPFLIVAGIAGLLFGTFAAATAHRLPRGESVIGGRSRCPHCKTALGPLRLIPVISYVMNRGRCAACAAPISPRYPLTETATAVLCAISSKGSMTAEET